MSDRKEAALPRSSFFGTVRTVAWSFFGVRKRAGHDQDMQKVEPVHVIVAGVAGAALFVAALVLLVRWVVGSGVAGS